MFQKISLSLVLVTFAFACEKSKPAAPTARKTVTDSNSLLDPCKNAVQSLIDSDDYRPLVSVKSLSLSDADIEVAPEELSENFSNLNFAVTPKEVPGFIAWKACSVEHPENCSAWKKEYANNFDSSEGPTGTIKVSFKRCVNQLSHITDEDRPKFKQGCNSESTQADNWCCTPEKTKVLTIKDNSHASHELKSCFATKDKQPILYYQHAKSIISASQDYLKAQNISSIEGARKGSPTNLLAWNISRYDYPELASVLSVVSENLDEVLADIKAESQNIPAGSVLALAETNPCSPDGGGEGEEEETGGGSSFGGGSSGGAGTGGSSGSSGGTSSGGSTKSGLASGTSTNPTAGTSSSDGNSITTIVAPSGGPSKHKDTTLLAIGSVTIVVGVMMLTNSIVKKWKGQSLWGAFFSLGAGKGFSVHNLLGGTSGHIKTYGYALDKLKDPNIKKADYDKYRAQVERAHNDIVETNKKSQIANGTEPGKVVDNFEKPLILADAYDDFDKFKKIQDDYRVRESVEIDKAGVVKSVDFDGTKVEFDAAGKVTKIAGKPVTIEIDNGIRKAKYDGKDVTDMKNVGGIDLSDAGGKVSFENATTKDKKVYNPGLPPGASPTDAITNARSLEFTPNGKPIITLADADFKAAYDSRLRNTPSEVSRKAVYEGQESKVKTFMGGIAPVLLIGLGGLITHFGNQEKMDLTEDAETSYRAQLDRIWVDIKNLHGVMEDTQSQCSQLLQDERALKSL